MNADATGFRRAGRPVGWRLGVFAACGLVLAFGWGANAQAPDVSPDQSSPTIGEAAEPDCFEQLVNGTGARIQCSVPVVMSASELEQMRGLTRGFFKNAQCMMQIDIARQLVDDAQSEPDFVFISPPQPVACEIETSRSDFPVTFSFAPRVVFQQGKAVEATPGMGDIKGVGRMLSWPVEKWVNASDQIEEAMLRIINAFVARFGRKQPDAPDAAPAPTPGIAADGEITPIRLSSK